MLEYNQKPVKELSAGEKKITSFISGNENNIDAKTVASFGEEWTKFDAFTAEEIKNAGDQYFDIVTTTMLHQNSLVLDLGCGSGRWSKYIENRAGFIEGVDPSEAVYAAAHLTASMSNIRITQASSDNLPFADESFDFLMSLGVLHHIPDTALALKNGVQKVKKGGYVLLYLYYALDNRSVIFKTIFYLSAVVRFVVSSLPAFLKKTVCDFLAITVYLPFISLSKIVKTLLPKSNLYNSIPLSYYADKSFNIIRNDALDRFGTPLEQRFSKQQITKMMNEAGLNDLIFSENMPYWHVVGKKN